MTEYRSDGTCESHGSYIRHKGEAARYGRVTVHLRLLLTSVLRVESGGGTALQAGRLRVRFEMLLLELLIDIILPVALCPWGSTQPLTEMSTKDVSWWIKAAGVYG
jgi:hypothetical protein